MLSTPIQLTEFSVITKIGESLAAEVFLAKERQNNISLVLKRLRPKVILEGVEEHIEQQLAFLRQQNIDSLVIPQLRRDKLGLCLTQPLTEAQVLSHWLANKRDIKITTLLEIGIGLADCLTLRHQQGLIHKGIKPNNVLISENPIHIELLDEVRILDDMLLSQFIKNPLYCRATLPYIAPELTGRIRMNIGFYCDLYALGTLLYECACGRPPFLSDDPMALIHSHLAEIPRPVNELNPQCPAIIADIIATLLNKEPEQRYQSAKGLRSDLHTCLESLISLPPVDPAKPIIVPSIPSFGLRQHEYHLQINTPSVLIGRDDEQRQLLSAYDAVSQGEFNVVMISGLSGIGKTRLIQELEAPIVARRGYYCAGKFNQFSQQLPYASLIEAFSRLIRQLLSEDDERQNYWRQRFEQQLGYNAGLITEFIPELVHIIGPQAPLLPLPPAEARNRFNDTISRFIDCFTCEQHPLVLFIDDLQWCDQATFDLFEVFYSQAQAHPYLLLITAYRSNEVNPEHGACKMEKAVAASPQALLKIHLAPLELEAVNQMVAIMLDTTSHHSRALSKMIFSVSAGNPLYVNECLRWLYQHQRIAPTAQGVWQWDESSLAKLKLPGNAKALFADRLKQLPLSSQQLLATAALLGANFKLNDLDLVSQLPPQGLYKQLNRLISEHALQQNKGDLHFFHDQLQAAAADFLSVEEKANTHCKIAQAFIHQLQREEKQAEQQQHMPSHDDDKGQNSARLFSIVEHLAAGRNSQDASVTVYEEAQFNYRAGSAAMDTLALEASHHYLQTSVNLCTQHPHNESLWSQHYDFMFALYRQFARATLMLGQQNAANAIVTIASEHAQTDHDRALCLLEQSSSASSSGNMPTAIILANKALDLLGQPLPSAADEANQQTQALIGKLHSEYRDIFSETLNSPDIVDKDACLEMALYGELIAAYYVTGKAPQLFLIALRAMNLSVDSGLSDISCSAAAMLAAYFQLVDNYPRAASYEDLMTHLVKRFPNSFGAVRAMTTAVWIVSHDRSPIDELLKLCYDTVASAQRCGEIGYAGHTNCTVIYYLLTQSQDLDLLQQEIERIGQFSQQYNLSVSGNVARAANMALSPLWQSAALENETSIQSQLKSWQAENNHMPLACFNIFSAITAFFNHNRERAKQCLQHAENHIDSLQNSIIYRLWFVFRYLLNCHNGNNENTDSCLLKVKGWASHGPILRPYLALMEAESLTESNDPKAIVASYQYAIDTAQHQDYTLLEAFANERLGNYFLSQQDTAAETHLHCAVALYKRCGAINKMQRLGQSLHERRASPAPPLQASNGNTALHSRRKNNLRRVGEKALSISGEIVDYDKELDFSYLFNSVKAITSELNFNNLLKTIVSAVMGRLGAKSAYLLILEEDLLVPYVSATKSVKTELFFREEKGFSTSRLSMPIAYYVAHSKQRLNLKNAQKQGDFNFDETVLSEKLRSILCLPLIKQQNLLGVLYLENNLISDAFNDSQIELSSLLIAQAAVALENAKLIADMSEASAEISARERQQRAILDGLSVYAGLLNPEGEFIFANKTALQTLNIQLEDLIGMPLENSEWWSYSTAIQGKIKQDIQRAAQGQQVRKEYSVLASHHSTSAERFSIIDVTIEPIIDHVDKVLFLAICAVDITQSKRSEAQLKTLVEERSRELEQKQLQLAHAGRLASLGEMATGIAHELGQPLQIIKLAASILREELSNDDFERQEVVPMADDISAAVDEASLTLEHMRNFAIPDRGQQVSAIDLNQELHNCLVFFQQQFAQQNIQLALDIDEKLEKVAVIGQKFQQIVVNLISNARFAVEQKQARDSEQMCVAISLQTHPDGKQLILKVKDNGIGMSHATRQRCLEPFFTTKDTGQGTGLGLSIVNTLLQEFHFCLDIQSSLNAGSCFTVFMPVANKAL